MYGITVKYIYNCCLLFAHLLSILLNTVRMHDSSFWYQYSTVSPRGARERPGGAQHPLAPSDPPMSVQSDLFLAELSTGDLFAAELSYMVVSL